MSNRMAADTHPGGRVRMRRWPIRFTHVATASPSVAQRRCIVSMPHKRQRETERERERERERSGAKFSLTRKCSQRVSSQADSSWIACTLRTRVHRCSCVSSTRSTNVDEYTYTPVHKQQSVWPCNSREWILHARYLSNFFPFFFF